MVENKNGFLGKDITVHRISDKSVRGFCVNVLPEGLMINPKTDNFTYDDKFIFIPFSQIKEVYFEEAKE